MIIKKALRFLANSHFLVFYSRMGNVQRRKEMAVVPLNRKEEIYQEVCQWNMSERTGMGCIRFCSLIQL